MVRTLKPSDAIRVKQRRIDEGENNPINIHIQQAHYSKHTRKIYRYLLIRYFIAMDADPNTYFTDGRDYKDDLKKYLDKLIREKKANTSRVSTMAMLHQFFTDNNVEFTEKFWSDIWKRTGKSERITDDKPPTKDELREILSYADIKMRPMILMLSSSGMRIGELLHLTWTDIDLNSKPVVIRIKAEYTKTKTARDVFISEEAKDALLTWKKGRYYWSKHHKRDGFAKDGKEYFVKKGPVDVSRIFFTTYYTFLKSWNLLLKKSKLDSHCERTGRYQRHTHMLRAYFETNMEIANVPEIIVQTLLGHVGYCPGYKKPAIQQLAEQYQKGVHAVQVFTKEVVKEVQVPDEKLRNDFEQMKEQYDALRQQMNILMGDKLKQLSKKEKPAE